MSATFFPDPLPVSIRRHPRRAAECRTYDLLKRQLEDSWHVYYSRPWLGLDRDGRDKDGEADFVLAHPDRGMLVLEVKGGGIKYDAKADQWTSRNAEGNVLNIKNPARQATTSKHVLLRKFKELKGWDGRRINARIGVLFPDCDVPGSLAPDLPRYAVAGLSEMRHLGEWVERRITGPDEALQQWAALGDDGISLFDAYFASSFQLIQPLAATLLRANEEIHLLTEAQACVLDMLESHRRLAIPGVAGTGKTSLAIEKAIRLARTGHRTLFLCYNRALAQHLRAAFPGVPNLEVSSFHALVSRLCRQAALEVPPRNDAESLPSKEWGDAFLKAASRLAQDVRYDAIMIDEGQDFGEGWLAGVEALLRDTTNGILYVFYDDNQKVHLRGPSLPDSIPSSAIRLTRVLRNCRPVAEYFIALLPTSVTIAGPDGPAVEEMILPAPPAVPDLERLLSDLVEKRKIAPQDIAVLTRDRTERERLAAGGRIGRWPVNDAEQIPVDRIVCDSVRRFKGLERQVVVVVAPSTFGEAPELLYVALSRSCVLLVLVDSASGAAEVARVLRSRQSSSQDNH